tara:strand:- start:14536 stop:14763 length:228 start_codon:yes stop_codon:yes gene_type:complete
MIELKKKEKKEIDEPLVIWVCQDCGSEDVEEKMWVNANTQDITGSCNDDENSYCNDCQEHVGLIPEDEFIENEED